MKFTLFILKYLSFSYALFILKYLSFLIKNKLNYSKHLGIENTCVRRAEACPAHWAVGGDGARPVLYGMMKPVSRARGNWLRSAFMR
jgi:hypothetical protein